MRGAYTAQQIRLAEQQLMATLPDGALMQRAAAGLATHAAALLGRVYGAQVLVLAGAGNNGGDALFAAARLARRGAQVTVLASGEALHAVAAADLRAAGGRLLDAAPADIRADLVLDGMLGIGGRPGLDGTARGLAALAADARRHGAVVVAVDVPSGIDADTGWAPDDPAAWLAADVTVTFGALKTGLLIGPGRAAAGEVR
ncbi:MAG: yjeF-like protein hydroxyethylthiazole kinaserelated, partial [Pseudonocardiales bacterium]|nr:yjeF-like protein hydroxyethylthiazole kinaserelated [Pseudonocardiales bacterium]